MKRASSDVTKVRGVSEQLRNAAAAARAGADDLYAARQRALNLIDQVRAAGFEVSEDLIVTSRQTGGTAFDQLVRQAHAKAHAANIHVQAVALATLDQHVAAKISVAAAGVGSVSFTEAPIYTRRPHKQDPVQAVNWKQSPIGEPPPPDVPAVPAGRTAADLRAATSQLPQGTRPTINLLQSEEALRRLWNWATENAAERTSPTHPGTQRVLADGTIVSMRDAAASTGKPAIDVKYPDGSTQKFHVNETKGGVPNYPRAALAPPTPAPSQPEPPRAVPEPPPGRAPIPAPLPIPPELVELPGAGQNDPPPLDGDGIDPPPQVPS